MNTLTTAFLNIRRSPYQSLAAVLLLSLTFFVGYTFSLFLLGSEHVLRYFETRPQVIGFFELDTSTTVINELAQGMAEKPYVTEVKLVSQEEALEIYQEENKDDPLLLELVTSQILPASIEVSGTAISDLPQIKSDLEQVQGIDEVILQQDVIESLASWTQTIRIVGGSSVLLLGVTSLLIMIIIIGMKVVTKRPAITIMRMIGATSWFIQSPFVYEGMIYGIISSVIGWTLSFVGLLYLTPWLKSFVGGIPLFPVPWPIFALQLSIGTLVGVLLGAIAGSIAVARMIKR